MNQWSDSSKNNLRVICGEAPIFRGSWFLSHTARLHWKKPNRMSHLAAPAARFAVDRPCSTGASIGKLVRRLGRDRHRRSDSQRFRERGRTADGSIDNVASIDSRQCPSAAKPPSAEPSVPAMAAEHPSQRATAQFAGRLAVLFLAFAVLRAPTSGPGRKKRRHSGESWDFFWIMHAVMRSTSGMKLPHSRNASGVQACSCSGV